MPRYCLVIATILLIGAPFTARAQTTVAVVDVQEILAKSAAAASLDKQADAAKEKFRAEVSAQEQGFRAEEKKLAEQRGKLSKEDFALQARAFEEKLVSFRSEAQDRKRALDEAIGVSMGEIRAKLYEVVQQISAEKGIDLVITKQNVIVGSQEIDLTEETMKRLNDVISTSTLEIKSK